MAVPSGCLPSQDLPLRTDPARRRASWSRRMYMLRRWIARLGCHFLPTNRRANAVQRAPLKRLTCRLDVEALEDRLTPVVSASPGVLLTYGGPGTSLVL